MKNTYSFLFAILVSVYIYNGCAENIIKNGGGEVIDTNILRTDEFGNILGGDTTDWCLHPNGLSFGPAYPNPGFPVTVNFTLTQSDTLKLTIRNSLGGPETVLQQGPYPPGFYSIQLNGTNYLNTFQKLCISSKRYSPGAGCNFCGDIKFEQ